MKEENLAIGEAALLLGLSHDTLRYYERIGLLPPIARTPAGVRRYQSDDLSRLRFIQRTKSMGFTLDEIAALLKMRAAPREARQKVRRLTATKLAEVEERLRELGLLRQELHRLLQLCATEQCGCGILNGLSSDSAVKAVPERNRT